MANRYDYRHSRDYPRDYDAFYDWDNPAYPEYANRGYNQRRFNRTGYGYPSSSSYNRRYNTGYRSDYDNDYDYDYNQSRNFSRGYNPRFNREYDYEENYDYDWDNTPTWTYYEYWWEPGPYVGLGPQNYTRSDERIREDIHDRLTRHGRLDARNIRVDVNNGIVTLDGMVNTRRDKRLAEDLADDVMGVIDVNNHLRVNRQGQSWGTQEKQIGAGKIHTGMEVVGMNGQHAGTVKEIRDNEFLLDREMARDVFVPFNSCKKIQDGKIFLNVAADKVDNQGWRQPDIVGMSNS